jgi:hypothetical protein
MSMTRPTLTHLAAAAAAAAFAVLAGGATAAVPAAPCRGGLELERDPRALLPLNDANPVAAAASAALRFEPPARRPQVVSALLAPMDRQRGPQARRACGIRVWQRTVVVYITDRALLPAQSASQRVFFVGKFRDGYHVWQVAH